MLKAAETSACIKQHFLTERVAMLEASPFSAQDLKSAPYATLLSMILTAPTRSGKGVAMVYVILRDLLQVIKESVLLRLFMALTHCIVVVLLQGRKCMVLVSNSADQYDKFVASLRSYLEQIGWSNDVIPLITATDLRIERCRKLLDPKVSFVGAAGSLHSNF